jgi:hypothetical protein
MRRKKTSCVTSQKYLRILNKDSNRKSGLSTGLQQNCQEDEPNQRKGESSRDLHSVRSEEERKGEIENEKEKGK